MLEANKDKHFVAPGIAWLIHTSHHAARWGITPAAAKAMGYHRELEVAVETLQKMRKRGIRILPGGDYGFAWNPIGTNARDIEHFVNLLGFSPMDAIVSATRLGGEIMMLDNELGQVKPGFLADLILVDGNPLANVALLQDAGKLLAIMKDGAFHKAPVSRSAAQRQSA